MLLCSLRPNRVVFRALVKRFFPQGIISSVEHTSILHSRAPWTLDNVGSDGWP